MIPTSLKDISWSHCTSSQCGIVQACLHESSPSIGHIHLYQRHSTRYSILELCVPLHDVQCVAHAQNFALRMANPEPKCKYLDISILLGGALLSLYSSRMCLGGRFPNFQQCSITWPSRWQCLQYLGCGQSLTTWLRD